MKHGILKVNQDSVFCIQVMLQFLSGTLNLSAMKVKELIICQNNFRHSFSLTWSGKTCDIRRSL